MPDAVYNNRLVTQLINKVLLDGKKSTAERIVYGAFDMIKEKTDTDPLTIFKKTWTTSAPRSRSSPSVSAATYQVPMEANSLAPPPWPSAGRELLSRPQGEEHGRAPRQ